MVDGTIAGVGIPDEPVDADASRAAASTEASGPEGAALLELLTAARRGRRRRRRARHRHEREGELTGNVLEDEKLLGTAHVAFGASQAIGGRIQVPVHLDCVVMSPTLRSTAPRSSATGELLV